MKLSYQKVQVEPPILGVHAGVIRDEINGSFLVIQSDRTQIRLKLSDLVAFITEQEKEVNANPESEGAKGDTEAE